MPFFLNLTFQACFRVVFAKKGGGSGIIPFFILPLQDFIVFVKLKMHNGGI